MGVEEGQRNDICDKDKDRENIQSSIEANSKETEDIKPDISQLVDNNQHDLNNRSAESNINTNLQEAAMTNSFNNPGQMNNSFSSNSSMYPGINFQQLQQHYLQQQSTSQQQQQNFYPHESQMSANSNSLTENSNQE